MDLLLWITIGFITIGFIVLISMKKNMERKLAFINGSEGSEEIKESSTKSIIYWIVGTTGWGIVSMFLVVWWFSVNMQ